MKTYGRSLALNAQIEEGTNSIKVQLSPFGEFVLNDGSKKSGKAQHCSREAFEELVKNWRNAGAKDILVDVDHAAEEGGSTAAAAWLNSLTVEDDGLYGVFNLTPKGEELVKNRVYRFLSPAWTLKDMTPQELVSVALTNKPNLPVKPVVNQNKENPAMDKLKTLLGLAAEATEDDIAAAVEKLQGDLASMKQAAADKAAADFADEAVKNGKIAEDQKEAVKNAFLQSPEAAKAVLNAFKAPEKPGSDGKAAPGQAPQTILNADRAEKPDVAKNAYKAGLDACKSPAERVAFVQKHAKEYQA